MLRAGLALIAGKARALNRSKSAGPSSRNPATPGVGS